MKTDFYLCRHGETQWNVVKRLQGRLNSELTNKGQTQAQTLAQTLKTENIDVIVTSPLGRAHQTALVCQQHIKRDLVIEDGLTERHFGDWQGALFESLSDKPQFSEIFFEVTNDEPPNGESSIAANKRFTDALEKIARQYGEQNVLVVTHGDVLRSFFAQLKQKEFCDAYSQYGNGKYFRVRFCHLEKTFIAEIG